MTITEEYDQIGKALDQWLASQEIEQGRAVGALIHWVATRIGNVAKSETTLELGLQIAFVATALQAQKTFEERQKA